VFIKVLYVVLVLCTIALVGAVGAAYLKIRKHMRESDKASKSAAADKNIPGTPSGS
jgi:hypothetical protein